MPCRWYLKLVLACRKIQGGSVIFGSLWFRASFAGCENSEAQGAPRAAAQHYLGINSGSKRLILQTRGLEESQQMISR